MTKAICSKCKKELEFRERSRGDGDFFYRDNSGSPFCGDGTIHHAEW